MSDMVNVPVYCYDTVCDNFIAMDNSDELTVGNVAGNGSQLTGMCAGKNAPVRWPAESPNACAIGLIGRGTLGTPPQCAAAAAAANDDRNAAVLHCKSLHNCSSAHLYKAAAVSTG